MRSIKSVVITLPVGSQSIATVGIVGWWWMAKRNVGFMSILGLIWEWSMVTAEVRHGGGHGFGRMRCVTGVKPFSNVVRAAIPEGVVTMVSRRCMYGAHWTILREVRLC
jgi:hypothetical protein